MSSVPSRIISKIFLFFRVRASFGRRWSLAAALLGVVFLTNSPSTIAEESAKQTADGPRGEYVLRHSEAIGQDGTDYRKFCTPFTANLNEFRRLDFETCDAHLSPKYPQFSRPQWEEMPLDLEVAKKVLADRSGGMGFDNWLKATEAARKKGEVKLWRVKIDLLTDGNLDTLVKLDPAEYGERPYCSYYDSKQTITDIPDQKTAQWYAHAHFYNSFQLGGDMVYDVTTKHYYLLEWNRYGRAGGDGVGLSDIGATASVRASRANDGGVHGVCWIDWVPTGKRKPEQSPQPKTNSR